MRLSPLDIRKQEFTRNFRGFDAEEVQAFLQMVSGQWEEMLDQHRRLEERVREMESKLRHYEKVEEALQEALQTARESSRKALDNAEKQADLIVKEAEARAAEIKRDAVDERHEIKRDAAKLSSRRHEIVARLRAFLMSEMELLARFEGDDPIGFIKLLPADDRREARARGAHTLPPSPLASDEDAGLDAAAEADAAGDEDLPLDVVDTIAPDAPGEPFRVSEVEPGDAPRAEEVEDAFREDVEEEKVETYAEAGDEEDEPAVSELALEEEPHDPAPRALGPDAEGWEEEEEDEDAGVETESPPPQRSGPGWTVRPVISARARKDESGSGPLPETEKAAGHEREEEDDPVEQNRPKGGLSASDEEIEKIRKILKDLE